MPDAVLAASAARGVIAERDELRERVEHTLESLSRQLVRGGARASRAQEAVAFLGQVLAAWPRVPDDAFPETGAGFAATVAVEDLDTHARDEFTLMDGPLLDFDAGQVSLASPVGQALLGASPGVVVEIQLPQRLRRLRVTRVRTLEDKLPDYGN